MMLYRRMLFVWQPYALLWSAWSQMTAPGFDQPPSDAVDHVNPYVSSFCFSSIGELGVLERKQEHAELWEREMLARPAATAMRTARYNGGEGVCEDFAMVEGPSF